MDVVCCWPLGRSGHYAEARMKRGGPPRIRSLPINVQGVPKVCSRGQRPRYHFVKTITVSELVTAGCGGGGITIVRVFPETDPVKSIPSHMN